MMTAAAYFCSSLVILAGDNFVDDTLLLKELSRASYGMQVSPLCRPSHHRTSLRRVIL